MPTTAQEQQSRIPSPAEVSEEALALKVLTQRIETLEGMMSGGERKPSQEKNSTPSPQDVISQLLQEMELVNQRCMDEVARNTRELSLGLNRIDSLAQGWFEPGSAWFASKRCEALRGKLGPGWSFPQEGGGTTRTADPQRQGQEKGATSQDHRAMGNGRGKENQDLPTNQSQGVEKRPRETSTLRDQPPTLDEQPGPDRRDSCRPRDRGTRRALHQHPNRFSIPVRAAEGPIRPPNAWPERWSVPGRRARIFATWKRWSCQQCQATNEGGSHICTTCGGPATEHQRPHDSWQCYQAANLWGKPCGQNNWARDQHCCQCRRQNPRIQTHPPQSRVPGRWGMARAGQPGWWSNQDRPLEP